MVSGMVAWTVVLVLTLLLTVEGDHCLGDLSHHGVRPRNHLRLDNLARSLENARDLMHVTTGDSQRLMMLLHRIGVWCLY